MTEPINTYEPFAIDTVPRSGLEYVGLEDTWDGLIIHVVQPQRKDRQHARYSLFLEHYFVFSVNLECVKSLPYFQPGIDSFYKSYKTDFSEAFHNESVGIYRNVEVFEISILTADHWIQILTNSEIKAIN